MAVSLNKLQPFRTTFRRLHPPVVFGGRGGNCVENEHKAGDNNDH